MTKIGKGAFQGCARVTKFIVPDGVTCCEARAFARCPELTTVVYPKTLKILGEGQSYRSPKVKVMGFLTPPPESVPGRCPFKGKGAFYTNRAMIVTPFALARHWRNLIQEQPWGLCKDGCHKITCLTQPSFQEKEEAQRNYAGFIAKEIHWNPSGNLKDAQIRLLSEIEAVWREYDVLSSKRKLSLQSLYVLDNGTLGIGIPPNTAVVYVSTMFFKAGEAVHFKYCIDDYAMVMVDNVIAVDFSQDCSGRCARWYSSIQPVTFSTDGWHRIAIIAVNIVQKGGAGHVGGYVESMLGGVYYRRGNDKNWRMFEVTPDGKEFRVGPEDARRAIADIERAKQK